MFTSLKRQLTTLVSATAVILSMLTLGASTPASATPSYVSGSAYSLAPTYRLGYGLVSSGGYLWTMAIRAGDDETMLLQINKDTMALVNAVDVGNDGQGGGTSITYYKLASDSVHVWLLMPAFSTSVPDKIKEYDGATAALVRTIDMPLTTQTLGDFTNAMAITSDGTNLWVLGTDPELTGGDRGTQYTYFQYRISDGSLLRKIVAATMTPPLAGAFIHSDGTNVWLAIASPQKLYKFNIATLTTTASTTYTGIAASVFSDGTHVFISQKYSNTDLFNAVAGDKVFEYNTSNLALVNTISVDKNPYSIFSTGTSLWVGSWGSYPWGYGDDSAIAEYDTTTGALLSRSTATKTTKSPGWIQSSDILVPYNVTVVGSTAYAFTGVMGDTAQYSWTYKVVKLAPAPPATIVNNPMLGDMSGPSYAAGDQVIVMPGRWDNSTGTGTIRLYRCDTNTVTSPATDSTCSVLVNPLTSPYTIVSADAGKYLVATESITGLDGSTAVALSNFAKAAGGSSSGGGSSGGVCTTPSWAVCNAAYTYSDWGKIDVSWDAPSSYQPGQIIGYRVVNQMTNATLCEVNNATTQHCEFSFTPNLMTPSFTATVSPIMMGGSLGQGAFLTIFTNLIPQISGVVGSTGMMFFASPGAYQVGGSTLSLTYTLDGHTCTEAFDERGAVSFTGACTPQDPIGVENTTADTESGLLTPSTTYQVTGTVSRTFSYMGNMGQMQTISISLPVDFTFTTLAQPRKAATNVAVVNNGDGTYTLTWNAPSGTAPSFSQAMSTDMNYLCEQATLVSGSTYTCTASTYDSSAPAPTDWIVSNFWDSQSQLTASVPVIDSSTWMNIGPSSYGWMAFTSMSWSKASGATSTPVLPVAPGAVTSGSATAGNGSVTVTWSAPSSGDAPTRYEVSIPGQTTCVVDLVANPSAARSCTFTGLTNGTSYTATIVAKNSGGTSTGVTVSATPTAPVAPGAPSGVIATAGNGSAAVTWRAPSNTGSAPITSYTVTASPGGQTCTVNAPAVSCTVTGLTNGTNYTFSVTATSSAGTSSPSSASLSVQPYAVAPDAPTNVVAAAGEGQATITWTAPASDGGSPIDGYIVTSSPGGLTCTAVAPDTSCVITGLTNGVAYTFSVVASNNVGTSDPSTSSNSITPASGPSAPDRVQVTPGNHSATVDWAKPADGASPTSYVVTMNPGGRTCTVDVFAHPTAALRCTFTGLTNGVVYTFTVTALTANGQSASDTVAATPAAGPTKPSAPRGVKFRGSVAGVATVTWKVSGSNGGSAITKYIAYVYGPRFMKSCTVNVALRPAAPLTCSFTGLKPKRFYTYRVVAVNAIGKALSPKAQRAIDVAVKIVSFAVGKTTMWSGLYRQAFITAGYIKRFKYTKVTLTGYTNPGGTLAGRTRFTQARALTVANYFTRQLRAMGVKNVTVVAVGTGASIYKGPSLTTLQRKKNRSVTTLLSYK